MPVEPTTPPDPLGFIKRCVSHQKIKWTYHVNMRLNSRFIPRENIIQSVQSFEIIESYPGDKYLPSYLMYAHFGEDVFHILFAIDVSGDHVRIITAYRPNENEWELNLKRRRVSP